MNNAIETGSLCMGCMSGLEHEGAACSKCGFDLKNHFTPPHHLKPYTILNGKYLIGKVLGEGGFGITYLGWDLNLDIKIAIKEYYPAGLVTREVTSIGTGTVMPYTGDKSEIYRNGLDKFVNEAKSLAKFYALPGIVAVKDFFRENGTAYIVMEFVDGITLKQHLQNSGGKLRPNEVLELIRPLMKSLSQVHAEGIIHRDISPDNIMLTNKGDIKLLDFGAAREYASGDSKSRSVLLKPGYAPAEQYKTRGHQGPWTDVYALCATIYKMITGVTPPESLERYDADELVPPTKLGVQLSKQTEDTLLKGLAVSEKNRYQSIDALYLDIYGTSQYGQSVPIPNVIPQPPVAPQKQEYVRTVELQESSQPVEPQQQKAESVSQNPAADSLQQESNSQVTPEPQPVPETVHQNAEQSTALTNEHQSKLGLAFYLKIGVIAITAIMELAIFVALLR